MSKRQIKKLFGNTIPSNIDSSDEEYEPHCSYLSKKSNAYEGLEVQSSKLQQEQSEDKAKSDIKEKNKPTKKNKNKSKQSDSGSLEVQLPKSEQEQSEDEAKDDIKENKPKKKNKNKSKQSKSCSLDVQSSKSEQEQSEDEAKDDIKEKNKPKKKNKNKSKQSKFGSLDVQSSKSEEEQSEDEAKDDIKEKNKPKKKNKNKSKQSKSCSLEVQSSKSQQEQSENEAKSDIKEKNKPKKKNNKSKQSTSGSDDIDQIVREVNAMIGEPSPAVNPVNEKKPLQFLKVFSVRKRHLNVTNELNRLLGPDETEGKKKKTPAQRDIVRNQITPLRTSFQRRGLGMDVYDIREGITYFVYTHNESYQRQHHELINYLARREDPSGGPVFSSIENFHVEGMLQVFKLYSQSEEYKHANSIIENALAYLQFVADPLFNICNGRTRLEYRFTENRAFHIVVLVYSYLLSNKACHRTALELAKMLINLDPTDPLGVVFVIDTFAIRAREYEWLLEAIEYWEIRDAGHLYNMKYSKALAQFHVSTKKKEDLKQADELLKKALMWFPSGLSAILTNNLKPTSRTEKLCSHDFFTIHLRIPHVLWDMIKFYGALIGSRWMEQPVLEWLLRNAEELIDMLESDPELKKNATVIGLKCRTLFRNCPTELCRHIIIVKPLSDLIADGLVPSMPVFELNTHYFNPLPVASATVNRYNYPTRT